MLNKKMMDAIAEEVETKQIIAEAVAFNISGSALRLSRKSSEASRTISTRPMLPKMPKIDFKLLIPSGKKG